MSLNQKPPKFEALIKTCIAFANGSGGRIIIGVDDISHEVIGVEEDDRARIHDDFPNSLYDLIQPSLVAQIYEKNHDGKSVIIIEIPPNPRMPCFLKSKNIQKGTYIRVGSSTRLATQEYIEDLTREAQRITFDEETVGIGIEALSNDILSECIDGKIIARRHANADEYCPTVAGILMCPMAPHNSIPEVFVRCTKFRGVEVEIY